MRIQSRYRNWEEIQMKIEKRHFFIKTCDVMTLWAACFLYLTLIYSQYELFGGCIAGFNISIAICYADE